MDPNKNVPLDHQNKSSSNSDQTNDEAYARSLAHMAALDYSLTAKPQPAQKHFISKKFLIYTIISLVVSILGWVIFSVASKNQSNGNQTQQLLNGLKEVKDLQK